MKVAVVGAAGRMGRAVCEAVESASDMELVARLDAADEITVDSLNGAQAAVEFTVPSASMKNVEKLVAAGTRVVVGTTGWTEENLARVREILGSGDNCVLVAPNFALSAVLAMHFARQAASFFESAEVIELHHPQKVDAPSGTALATAQGIAQSREQAGLAPIPDATESDPRGARGADVDGVRIHAVRLRGLVAHEEVLFGNPGEQLSIRTDCFDRSSFMPGILLALRQVCKRQGLLVGLESVMDFE